MKDYKALAEMIFKRKSVRTYSKKHVKLLDEDIDFIEYFNLLPLVKDIRVNVKLLRKSDVRNAWSEYCIGFYSEEKPFYLENIGFIGQQIDLELQSKGIGTCWLGLKKPKKFYKYIDGLDCIITMAAGTPQNQEIRTYPESFNRKSPQDIIIGDTETNRLIQAVSIAPSAVNMQPWLIEKKDNKYNFYMRNPVSFIEKIITSMRHIDIGIAMAHFFIQAKADGAEPVFGFEGNDIEQGKFIASILI